MCGAMLCRVTARHHARTTTRACATTRARTTTRAPPRAQVEGVVHAASAVQHWFEEIGDSIGQTARSIEGAIKGSPAPFAAGAASTEETPEATWALSEGGRIDWMLQETELEVANEYLSALQVTN